jgi:hypothetical protein
MGPMRELAKRLIDVPGVVAVTLGGPHACGPVQADSGWHFRPPLRRCRSGRRRARARLRGHRGRAGGVGAARERRRPAYGGGSAGRSAYGDLDVVQHWLDEAQAGRYEVDQAQGYLAGMASYVLVGELALAEVLAGELPRPGFPDGFDRARPPDGGAAPPARWRLPTPRRSGTTSFRARACSQGPPSRPPRRRSPSAASGR